MKALFITHDISNYGASRSLQHLLRNYYGDVSIDLLVQKPIRKKLDHDDIRKRFGQHVNKIFESFLPFDPCYQYARHELWYRLFLKLYNRFFWQLNKSKIESIISAEKYDFIHLNSLVLHPIINAEHKFILHMRDVYDGSNPKAVQNIQQAAGIIFIDEATKYPFRNVALPVNTILNNPFDMTRVAEFEGYNPGIQGFDPKLQTVYSIVGVISEKKGTKFIIQSFMRFGDKNSRLLVVGGREKDAIDEYRNLARSDSRIIFWGEEPDIAKVYAISDYILRGEAFPCIGRTVYEGLYAGCRVIIPGDPDNPPKMFEYDRYRDAIFFYHPRNENDLLRVFKLTTKKKIINREYRSNIESYILNFHAFVSNIVAGRISK